MSAITRTAKQVFECKLTERHVVYKSGDYVSGQVLVDLPEVTKIRGIDLRFLGQAVVNWSESKRSQNDSRQKITKGYRNKETYFDATLVLFGRGEEDPGESVDHPAGPCRYPFQFKLPPDLPPTFHGLHGSASYCILGHLDIPWAPDLDFKQKIKVTTDLNLNDVPPAQDALVGRDEKTLCCLCCKHGPIMAEFSIPQAGYVPGEIIPISATVSNNSRRKILRTEVKLKQSIIYVSSGGRQKFHNKEIMSIVDEEDILKGGNFQWENEPIKIPKCAPSFLPYCGIIDIRYELVFNIDVAGTSIDMEMPLELIIGTIPLRNSRGDPGQASTLPRKSIMVTPVVTYQPEVLQSPFEGSTTPTFQTPVTENTQIETLDSQKPSNGTQENERPPTGTPDNDRPSTEMQENERPPSETPSDDKPSTGIPDLVVQTAGTPLPTETQSRRDSSVISGLSVHVSDSGSDSVLPAAVT